MIISIVGMPGSGKTFLGKKMAQAISVSFYDLDAIIEEETGESIGSLINKGAQHFRMIESTCLKKFIASAAIDKVTILACGGGTPCFENNMLLLNEKTTTMWLDSSIPLLLKNIKQDTTIRPLLEELSNESLHKLLQQRKAYYQQAQHHMVLTKEIDSIFVQECIHKLNIPVHE